MFPVYLHTRSIFFQKRQFWHKTYWPDTQTDASKRKSTSNFYRKQVLIFNFGLYKPFMSFLQKSAIFISNCMFSLKTVNCDHLQRSRNAKLVSFWRTYTAVIFWIIKEHLGGISRNLESNLLKTLDENCEKSTFPPKITHLSMELELVIGTIGKCIKNTIKMHILIFDIAFQEKVKNYFLFSVIFA